MFNGLQEGIIVVDDFKEITFMNELSNKVLTELSGMKNFSKNRDLSGQISEKSNLDLNMFFLFENDKTN
jgi:sensor histidine kinase regulating citrate/malate metabolism